VHHLDLVSSPRVLVNAIVLQELKKMALVAVMLVSLDTLILLLMECVLFALVVLSLVAELDANAWRVKD